MLVASDARRDDHARRNPELLRRQIDRLCRLDAAQLIDGKRMAVNTATATTFQIRQVEKGGYSAVSWEVQALTSLRAGWAS